MAFFDTPSLQKARGCQHQPSPTLPPFHIHTPFSTSSPCSYLSTEVLQFEYIRLIFDPKLTMHLATTEAIRRAAHGQSVTQTVSYSLRHDKKRSQLTPTQNLGLWKSTVIPHFLQNLRCIQSPTDVAKLQSSLNLSLARALHVYGDLTTLLADTGFPPFNLIQNTHLAQLHICLTKTQPDTLPFTLFKTFNKPLALNKLHPSTLDYRIACSSCPPFSALSACSCSAGFGGSNTQSCSACEIGKFKASQGNAPCSLCPPSSFSVVPGSIACIAATCPELTPPIPH